MYKTLSLILAMLSTMSMVSVEAAEFTVTQKDKVFSLKHLKIKLGDTVGFRNDDPFFHNIFSLSDIQSFDIGYFQQGQTRKVTFNKEGKIEVEIAIIPDIKMVIEVTKYTY